MINKIKTNSYKYVLHTAKESLIKVKKVLQTIPSQNINTYILDDHSANISKETIRFLLPMFKGRLEFVFRTKA